MYKYAAVYLIINFIFTFGLCITVTTSLKPAIEEANKIIEHYTQSENQDISYEIYYENGHIQTEKVTTDIEEYDMALNTIKSKLVFWLVVPSILFNIIFGLLADCIYKRFVIKNCRYTDGGTSIWSMIVGILIYQLVTNAFITPLITDTAVKILQ